MNATSGVLTYSAAGSCVVRTTAAATVRYSQATTDVTFVVTKVTPTLTSMSNIAKSDSDASFTPSAPSASFGGSSVSGTLSYSSATTSVATVNATTGAVTIVGVGTSVITASFTPTNTNVYNVTTGTYRVTVTDQTAPTVSVTAATISSSGSATVSSSEAGSVYLVSSSVSVTGVPSITSANGSLWNSVVATANTSTALSATGLSDGTYYAYATDAAGNLSSQSADYVTIQTVSCANGGVCSLGEIGPGGGMVFYASASGFTCGLNSDQTCNYLEIAPRDWYLTTCGAPDVDCKSKWQTSGSTSLLGTVTTFGRSLFNAGLIETSLGTCSSPVSSCNASGKARQYRGGSKSDWTLPTSGDLEKIKDVYYSHIANCTELNSSCYALERDVYLTSSESSATAVNYVQLTKSGWVTNSGILKTGTAFGRVRPVRSFAPIP